MEERVAKGRDVNGERGNRNKGKEKCSLRFHFNEVKLRPLCFKEGIDYFCQFTKHYTSVKLVCEV